MAGHGGTRPGAGRPRGGVSDARRVLHAGITEAFARAAREAGRSGTREQLAESAVADIAGAMIRAGRGDEVLKLYAAAQLPAPSGPDADGAGSPLLNALQSLPGMSAVPDRSGVTLDGEASADGSEVCARGATDSESVAPAVEQLALVDWRGVPRANRVAGRAPRARDARDPRPRAGGAPPAIEVGADRFEKNSGEAPCQPT